MQSNHYLGPIAEWYDDWLFDRRDDVDFYTSFFDGFAGSVLELACGTGRILLPIAKQGVRIEGLDSSKDMLEVLRRKALQLDLSSIHVYHQSMESFTLDTSFDAIFIAGGSFQLLTLPEAAIRSLTCIREHLTQDGFFLADLFIPWDDITLGEISTYRTTRDVKRTDGKRSIVLERFSIDIARQLKLGIYCYEFYDNKYLTACITDDLAIRWYWKDEFVNLLREAGFTKIEILDDSTLFKEGYSFVFKAFK